MGTGCESVSERMFAGTQKNKASAALRRQLQHIQTNIIHPAPTLEEPKMAWGPLAFTDNIFTFCRLMDSNKITIT